MAAEIDLRFVGEQIKQLQGDVRLLKSDMATMRADNANIKGELVAIDSKLSRFENNFEAFREPVEDRFDQQIELMKSSFRALSEDIQSLKKN